jgi:hypothetical protein
MKALTSCPKEKRKSGRGEEEEERKKTIKVGAH